MRKQAKSSPEMKEIGPNASLHPHQLLAAIVECSDDAIISKNLQGNVTTWNAAATRIFGYAPEEIIGQSILLLIPEELHNEEDLILRKVKAGERVEHYETTRIKKGGERVEVSITISPIRDENGRIIGASKLARDISGHKQMERLLIQSEKLAATGRMAATIAHEINNPLDSVMNLIFLARTSSSMIKARGYLQTAEKELERVAHISRQTLGYYRETGAPVEVKFRELIEDVLTAYQGKLRSKRISIDCEFNEHDPISVNKGEMLQVFSNIIANSVDAMNQEGVLKIQIGKIVHSAVEGVQIMVRDNGMGIRQEHLGKIFEPFFTTKGDLGTGIGLWVTKQLIENHGGNIVLTSCTDAGKSGTTLSIFVPFANPVSSGKTK